METAWGHKTGPLTADERKILTERLRCTIEVEARKGTKGTKGTHEIVRGFDGSYVGPTDLPDVRGYLRWLITHQIIPQMRSGTTIPSGEERSACVGKSLGPDGGWVGWSHRGARWFKTQAEAEKFAEEVS